MATKDSILYCPKCERLTASRLSPSQEPPPCKKCHGPLTLMPHLRYLQPLPLVSCWKCDVYAKAIRPTMTCPKCGKPMRQTGCLSGCLGGFALMLVIALLFVSSVGKWLDEAPIFIERGRVHGYAFLEAPQQNLWVQTAWSPGLCPEVVKACTSLAVPICRCVCRIASVVLAGSEPATASLKRLAT